MNSVSESTRGRRFLKIGAWALGGAGSIVAFCANVTVEDAKTNIGGWINLLGIDRIPGFLLSSKNRFGRNGARIGGDRLRGAFLLASHKDRESNPVGGREAKGSRCVCAVANHCRRRAYEAAS